MRQLTHSLTDSQILITPHSARDHLISGDTDLPISEPDRGVSPGDGFEMITDETEATDTDYRQPPPLEVRWDYSDPGPAIWDPKSSILRGS
ncbi:hypothetical protein NPIL_653441 [Nephila pilipes]|uniref:Uncharacterized protein n=1 Tax=Nephila pilipes TaxID=299642 RepID=A0A8X6TS88_NEPPI|nr:hypothetical protein NPIL_653441 [Nephila pilipes]